MFKQLGNYILEIASAYPLKAIVRHKRNIAKQLHKKRISLNPGVQQQTQLLFDSPNERHNITEANDLESLESDFMNVGNTYLDHQQQIVKLKEQEKLLIVKQKYFKETYPNFLTWNDKKQIQYLNKLNPEEWTMEKLSDGFPALPDTIEKIVKATWTKRSTSKIVNHDNSVKRNWELFKNGQINLPPKLTNHLHKFTDRTHNCSHETIEKNIEITKDATFESSGEFADIIQSYKCIKAKTKSEMKSNSQINATTTRKPKHDMYLTSETASLSKHTTLSSLKATVKVDSSLGKQLEEDDKILLNLSNNTIITDKTEPSENYVIDLKDVSKTAYISTTISSKKDEKHLTYPEKIIIPKDKLRFGCTYKLNDCYYDSDGLFLYRVPGMEN